MQTGGQLPDGSHFYDIVRGGIDKGAGLADLCEKMGLSLAEAVAAGDSANDVGMLKRSRPRLLYVQRHRRSQSRR